MFASFYQAAFDEQIREWFVIKISLHTPNDDTRINHQITHGPFRSYLVARSVAETSNELGAF